MDKKENASTLKSELKKIIVYIWNIYCTSKHIFLIRYI